MPDGVIVGKLMPLVVLDAGVLRPVNEILMPLIVTDPEDPPLVKVSAVRLVLFAAAEAVCEKRPLLKVRLPAVSVALPAVRVKFLPEAMVVSPLRATVPVLVLKVPPPVIAKLPAVCE